MSESLLVPSHYTVAGTPTAVTVTRTAATNVIVSWIAAPSTGLSLGGYEVFYQTAAESNGSSTTTTTELTLTGLMLGQTYSIFVVAFGPEGAPVLPSAHSNTAMITLGEFISYNTTIGNLWNFEVHCQQVKKCFITNK